MIDTSVTTAWTVLTEVSREIWRRHPTLTTKLVSSSDVPRLDLKAYSHAVNSYICIKTCLIDGPTVQLMDDFIDGRSVPGSGLHIDLADPQSLPMIYEEVENWLKRSRTHA